MNNSEVKLRTLSEIIRDKVDQNARPVDRPSVFSNTWIKFFHFLTLRNRGYGIRKIFNLLTEVIELGCMAYVMDISLMQSFLLMPITHMIIGYLQEYHTILYRATYNKKANLVYIFGVFLAIASMMYFMFSQSKSMHIAIFIIFGLRCAVIVSQTIFTCHNITLLATRRVRPNFKLQWFSLLVAVILALGTLQLSIHVFYTVITIGLIFNLLRFFQEFIYYKIVKNEIYQLRYVKDSYERPSTTLTSAWQETTLIGLHLTAIVAFSFKYHYFTFFRWPILVFFIISFYDRILSRPFRSTNLEITRLLEKNYLSFTHRLSRRLLLISFGFTALLIAFILQVKQWPMSHMLPTISLLAVCVINNALLSARKVSLWASTLKINTFIGIHALLILALVLPYGANYPLYILSSLITLWGIHIMTYEHPVLDVDHRIRNNALTLIPKHLKIFEVQWNNFSGYWQGLTTQIKKYPLLLLNFNSRTKYFYADNEIALNSLLNQYPLNIERIKLVDKIPALEKLPRPEKAQLAHLDYFGFWSGLNQSIKLSEVESYDIHYFNRRWQNRNIYAGGSKELGTDNHTLNMAHPHGNYLWFRKK